MTHLKTTFAALAGSVGFAALMVVASLRAEPAGQNRKDFSLVDDGSGHVALGLALRKVGVSGTFMQAPAHPDDETNVLFVLFGHGMGLRAIDVQNNRGEGGQNEIGPELFRDIGVLRTSELLSAHRLDGAEQYFTRAIDYGYSFDPQEVINKWGREAIVGDYVRLIRTLRPDVMLTMNIQGGGGDRAHEATTLLAREAYRAAGDPARYPEQLAQGLRPWQPYKLYFAGGGGGGRGGAATPPAAHVARIDTNIYDPLLGRTYSDIAADARSNHKCQGIAGMPPLPGGVGGARGGGQGPLPGARGNGPGGAAPGGAPNLPVAGGAGPVGPGGGGTYTLMETTIPGARDKDETSLFDGVDTTLLGVARFAGPTPPAGLVTALATITNEVQLARDAFASGRDAATAAPLESGLAAIRALRGQLGTFGLSDAARFEIDFRLRNEEEDFEAAVLAAHGLSFQALADDGLVVAGQPVRVSVIGVNRGATDVEIGDVRVNGIDQPTTCAAAPLRRDAVFTCVSTGAVPGGAQPTQPYFTDNYWKQPSNPAISIFDPAVPFGVPFAPTPYRIAIRVRAGAVDIVKDVPVQFRYAKDLYFGDKRMEVNVVPAFSVMATPALAVFPSSSGAARPAVRDVFVTVTNSTKAAAQATVVLEVPTGWQVTPASTVVSFDKEDEARSARFVVTAAAAATAGSYTARATVTSTVTGATRFTSGYQEIEYPHVERRQVIKAAETSLKVIDVRVAPGLKVGYVMGVGDQVPPAIEQLGATLSLIDQNEMAWGNLSKYDVILTGVRAYERRADLRAYNRRLLDYAAAGGTVIVQYNKTEFNQAQYGPYPAQVGQGRVSDETVPVTVLQPAHAVFTFPNRIGPAAWQNWTQERGLYFLGQKDARYTDLVSMVDSFPDNPGEKLGSLVVANVGRGRWMYVGLGLWRQLPAGTPGAYQLLANLISLPKSPSATR